MSSRDPKPNGSYDSSDDDFFGLDEWDPWGYLLKVVAVSIVYSVAWVTDEPIFKTAGGVVVAIGWTLWFAITFAKWKRDRRRA